jgi:gluconolactonase
MLNRIARCCFSLVVASLVNAQLFAAEPPVPSGARVKAAASVAFVEGPAWHPSGNVYFTDISNNRIMRRDTAGALHVYRVPSGRANGLLFDHQGRLMACEGGGEGGNRRVTRTEANGTITVLTDRYQGKRYNSPNDLAVDSKGRIYFTDPRYGDRSDIEQIDKQGNAIEGVYRIDADGKVTRIISHEVTRPNGILVSADDRTLFVADNQNDAQGSVRKLWRFSLSAKGDVVAGSGKVLFDWGSERGPDGMAIDSQGRIYATAGFNYPGSPFETAKKYKAGVYIFSPEGKLLGRIPVPMDMVTNCTFGGDDLKTLFITAGHTLWSVPVNTPGRLAWPKRK